MAWEEQISQRLQRGEADNYAVENLGKNRVFSRFSVTNPASGGRYTVTVRDLDNANDNHCTCPDFRTNTLRTCKHILAVTRRLDEQFRPRQRRAPIQVPELVVDYGPQIRLKLLIPPRHSDQFGRVVRDYVDLQGFVRDSIDLAEFRDALAAVPERVQTDADAKQVIDRQIERREMGRREQYLLAKIDAGEREPFEGLLSVPLYDYQIRGAVFMACRGRCILGDDMGLGKTAQTLAAVELLARHQKVSRVLVIAPASVKYQWQAEVGRFTRRPAQVIDGGKAEREEQYSEEAFYRLVNYEQVIRDFDLLQAWKPDAIILDEAQRIKNWESKTARAVKRLTSRYAFALTGTPLENRLEELYSIVQFVDDRLFGPAFAFLKEHRVYDEQGRVTGYRSLDKVRETLSNVLLRRTRAEVLGQLPERTDSVSYVELVPAQRAEYDGQRAALAALLRKGARSASEFKKVSACLTRMRLICDALELFDANLPPASPKLGEFVDQLEDQLASRQEPGAGKVLVFSQWEGMLNLASARLAARAIPHALYHGGLTSEARREVLDRFLNEDACKTLLATDAAATGLNLQAADLVVNLELPWNPATLEQRVSRAHRMGQTRPVQVINFVARDTIEQRVQRALEAKRELFAGVFDGDADEVSLATFDPAGLTAEIEELLGGEAAPRRPREANVVEAPAGLSPAESALVAAFQALSPALAKVERRMLPPGVLLALNEQVEALRAWLTPGEGEA